jgi:hypothetical protein
MTSTDLLKSFLGDTYALMIKTHFFHWNVTGPEFPVLHALFEKQYTDLFEAADVVAERVRALDDHPPGGAKTFAQPASPWSWCRASPGRRRWTFCLRSPISQGTRLCWTRQNILTAPFQ